MTDDQDQHRPAESFGRLGAPAHLVEVHLIGAGLGASTDAAYQAGEREPIAVIRLHVHLPVTESDAVDCSALVLALDIDDVHDMITLLTGCTEAMTYLNNHIDHPEDTSADAMRGFVRDRMAMLGALQAAVEGQVPDSPADL